MGGERKGYHNGRRMCRTCREHGRPRKGCYTCDPEMLRKRHKELTTDSYTASSLSMTIDGNANTEGWESRGSGH